MTFVASIKNKSIADFLRENGDMECHSEVPSLYNAAEQEVILESMANKNYHFDVFVTYENTINNNPVYSFVLVFDDEITKTEYEFLK